MSEVSLIVAPFQVGSRTGRRPRAPLRGVKREGSTRGDPSGIRQYSRSSCSAVAARYRHQTRLVPTATIAAPTRLRRWTPWFWDTDRTTGLTDARMFSPAATTPAAIRASPSFPRSRRTHAYSCMRRAVRHRGVTGPRRRTRRRRSWVIRRRGTRRSDTRDSMHRCSRRAGRT
jgi:hypothetical protein